MSTHNKMDMGAHVVNSADQQKTIEIPSHSRPRHTEFCNMACLSWETALPWPSTAVQLHEFTEGLPGHMFSLEYATASTR